MKLLLDGQPVEVRESNPTPLRTVIERISEEIRPSRVISEIFLDGKLMGGWDDPEITSRTVAQCRSLELISEEPRALAHKVLYEIGSYMPRIQEALVSTSASIQSGKEEEGLHLLHEISSTWAELFQGLQNALIVTGLDSSQVTVEGKTFIEINEELHQLLEQVSDLVEGRQFLELSDILEYEIAPRIPQVEEGIYRIIREIEKKPH